MSDQDKRNAAEGDASTPQTLGTRIDDPPPPYTPSKPSSDPKPPPLPSVPPAIIRDPLPASRPRISHSPERETTEYTTYAVWEGCKTACGLAVCWSWVRCLYCANGCARICTKSTSRRNQ